MSRPRANPIRGSTTRPRSTCGRRFLPEPEIAARAALHDGLAALELDVVVEAFQHGVIAAALQLKAEIAQAPLLVELSVAAARHVEVEVVVALFEHLHIKSAARAAPYLVDDAAQARHAAAEALRRFHAISHR